MAYSDELLISCPYCGESIDLFVDESAGSQTYYEDCAVCCSPILITITETETGEFEIQAQRDDD